MPETTTLLSSRVSSCPFPLCLVLCCPVPSRSVLIPSRSVVCRQIHWRPDPLSFRFRPCDPVPSRPILYRHVPYRSRHVPCLPVPNRPVPSRPISSGPGSEPAMKPTPRPSTTLTPTPGPRTRARGRDQRPGQSLMQHFGSLLKISAFSLSLSICLLPRIGPAVRSYLNDCCAMSWPSLTLCKTNFNERRRCKYVTSKMMYRRRSAQTI